MNDKIWLLIYNFLVVPPLFILVKIASLFNNKVKLGIAGRKRLFEDLIISAAVLDRRKKLIWVHSSSLGEFEQAKPVIEKIKSEIDVNILVTFFSPSGYLNSKNYPHADLVSYIPFDTLSNAQRFITVVNPSLAIFMRYDIWPNHVFELAKQKIPSILIDATMLRTSARTKPVAKSFHKQLFKQITKILTVSQEDADNFKLFNCEDEKLLPVGDTRFDRVYQRSLIAKEKNLIREELLIDKKVIVTGSTWGEDEEVLIPVFVKIARYCKDVVFIIAPHEPTLIHLEKLENDFAGKLKTIRFSSLNNYNDERVIIVDSIGILLTLYYYADIAFVGGSFKSNVHNVLEAAVYGIPVLFGPKILNSREAIELSKLGGGIMVKNKKEAYRQIRTLITNDDLLHSKGIISKEYTEQNLGATDKIIGEIYKFVG